jgi:GntR family transcriptional regulator/MocR family aminotransferase
MHEQLAEQLAAAIDSCFLIAGSRLPSTRTLAGLLEVSRWVVVEAYEILFARGDIEGRPGSGSYVSGRPADADSRLARPWAHPDIQPIDMTPGQPSTEGFPLGAWRAAWRHASFQLPQSTDVPALGTPELRAAVAGYLLRTRGVSVASHDVVITGGMAHGLRLALETIGVRESRIAVEDPNLYKLKDAVRDAGGAPVSLPVDADGARTDQIPESCRVTMVSAEGNEPLGHVLSAERRHRLAEWTRQTGGWAVEIDSNHVFRRSTGLLPKLVDLAGERGVIVGSFCGVLTPALRLGYLLVPRDLRLGRSAHQPSHVTQLALAHLLTEGTIVRRMQQLDRAYNRKRALVVEALPGVRLADEHGARSVVAYLPDSLDADQICVAMGKRGILVRTLASFQSSNASNALVLGYGHLCDSDLYHALSVLRQALDPRRHIRSYPLDRVELLSG